MKRVTVAPIVLVAGLAMLAVPARAQDVKEPRTRVSFPVKQDGMTLLGVGVRTKTFLKVKVYAAGFYVADAALATEFVPPDFASIHARCRNPSEYSCEL